MKNWYKKIRIDSFSQGSVLVDYFVELVDVPQDINTLEIKQMFHNALTEVPMTVILLKNSTTTTSSTADADPYASDSNDDIKQYKSNYLMGKFLLDPISTDFIGTIAFER